MRRLPALLVLLALSGCAAIRVTETVDSCTLSGSAIETKEWEAPQADYEFRYEGNRCFVRVGNGQG